MQKSVISTDQHRLLSERIAQCRAVIEEVHGICATAANANEHDAVAARDAAVSINRHLDVVRAALWRAATHTQGIEAAGRLYPMTRSSL